MSEEAPFGESIFCPVSSLEQSAPIFFKHFLPIVDQITKTGLASLVLNSSNFKWLRNLVPQSAAVVLYDAAASSTDVAYSTVVVGPVPRKASHFHIVPNENTTCLVHNKQQIAAVNILIRST